MGKAVSLECPSCGRLHAPDRVKYSCPDCGSNLRVLYDYDSVRKTLTRASLEKNPDRSIWRYIDLLPVADIASAPKVSVGPTPLYKAEGLGRKIGFPGLYVKDEGRNPSCSFKDRASAVVAAYAMERGEPVITAASTGNAASSLACMTASLPLKSIIFVPKTAPAAKITQLLVFGAVVITVEGTYDDAFNLCIEASKEYGWYNRNTGYNPYTREGKKTCAFEICEQFGWNPPDAVFVSVGDGNIISGLWKGFRDFHRAGLIDRLPRLIAVQAEGSNAVKKAFEGDGVIRAVGGETVADSISVSLPRDGAAAVAALKESGGSAVEVSDNEILAAIPELARGASVFAEPAGSAAFAGVKKAVSAGLVRNGETAVAVITGNGLKDIKSAMKSVGNPYLIRPEIGELKKLVSAEKLA